MPIARVRRPRSEMEGGEGREGRGAYPIKDRADDAQDQLDGDHAHHEVVDAAVNARELQRGRLLALHHLRVLASVDHEANHWAVGGAVGGAVTTGTCSEQRCGAKTGSERRRATP